MVHRSIYEYLSLCIAGCYNIFVEYIPSNIILKNCNDHKSHN